MSQTAKPAPTEIPEPTAAAALVPDGAHCWLAGASRIGAHHSGPGAVREDAFCLDSGECRGRRWHCIAVADGVGAAARAADGARISTRTFVGLVRQAAEAGALPANYRLQQVLVDGAWGALQALDAARTSLGCGLVDFGTTLLALVAIENPLGGLEVACFQAGNGLFAASYGARDLRPLFDPKDERADGAIHDLTSPRVRERWVDHCHHAQLPSALEAIILATDGVSDDLVPLRTTGPALVANLQSLPVSPVEGAAALLALLSYEKRGSTDDRTLAFLLPKSPAGGA